MTFKEKGRNLIVNASKRMPEIRSQNPLGRPSVMDERVLAKLEDAIRFGATKHEACLWAEIDESTLWRYEQSDPTFAMKIEAWQNELVSIARVNIAKSIRAGDLRDSWSFLKAKRKEEFAEQKNLQTYPNAVTAEDLEAIARGDIEITND